MKMLWCSFVVFFVLTVAYSKINEKGEFDIHSKEPMYKNVKLILEQVQVFGGNVDENLDEIIGRVDGLAIDDSGNVYIADGANCCVKKFGKDGEFIQNIGGAIGQGPGEYGDPRYICWDKNILYVLDFDKKYILKFHDNGDFICNIDCGGLVRDIAVDGNKLYVVSKGLKFNKPVQVYNINSGDYLYGLGYRSATISAKTNFCSISAYKCY